MQAKEQILSSLDKLLKKQKNVFHGKIRYLSLSTHHVVLSLLSSVYSQGVHTYISAYLQEIQMYIEWPSKFTKRNSEAELARIISKSSPGLIKN